VPPEGQLAESTRTHDQHARGVRTL
jgi:hypothetical protein